MTTDFFSSPSSPSVVAGLFVAGLGAVYAYARMGPGYAHADDRAETSTSTLAPHVDEDARASDGSERKSGSFARRRRRKKTKRAVVSPGPGEGEEEDDEASRAVGGGGGGSGGVPGGFDGAHADAMDLPVVPRAVSLPGTSGKKKKKQGKGKGRDKDRAKTEVEAEAKDGAERDDEEGSETGKEDARTAHAGDSTDASVSRPPSAPVTSTSAPASSRAIRAGSKPHSDRARAASRPREIRPSPSLSLDTDSSWTHVGRKRLEASGARTMPDSLDLTSSDMASTASNSPVVERMGGKDDVRGARTLAEKLVPRPGKSEVDDMLERPDGPTLARVMRVQEAPVPGFSWEDYGGDSLLVHDADGEDEGEWGVVKSRRRNHTQLPETETAPASSSSLSTSAMTKKQRQNARKRELVKSVKADTESARLEGLAKHKRELERVRSVEQSSRSRI